VAPPPIAFRIDPPLLRVRLEAPYEQADVVEVARRVFADPAFVPGLDVLAEVNEGSLPDTETIRERAKLLQELAPRIGSRIAVVARRDVDYGLARMLGTFVEAHGIELRVFREVSAAETWLRSATD